MRWVRFVLSILNSVTSKTNLMTVIASILSMYVCIYRMRDSKVQMFSLHLVYSVFTSVLLTKIKICSNYRIHHIDLICKYWIAVSFHRAENQSANENTIYQYICFMPFESRSLPMILFLAVFLSTTIKLSIN